MKKNKRLRRTEKSETLKNKDGRLGASGKADGLSYLDTRGARPDKRHDLWPGVNRSALARKLGRDRSMVSRWLSGRVMPEMDNAQELSRGLGIELSELVGKLKGRK